MKRVSSYTVSVIVAGVLASVFWTVGCVATEGTKGVSSEALKQVGYTLGKAYTFEPFHPAMRDHLWMDAGNGRAVFLHFDLPASDSQSTVIFVGEGIKGRFCAQDQPDGGKTGFVHFHRSHTPEGEKGMAAQGHGGKTGEEGYWLKHIAIGEFDMMGMRFKKGTAMNFMPTPAPQCG